MEKLAVKNQVSSDPQQFCEKWFETVNLVGKEFELPKISNNFDNLYINSELPMPKYSFQNLDNLFLSTIEKDINFPVKFNRSSTNQLGTMTKLPSPPLVKNHQVSHAKDHNLSSQIPVVKSTQMHHMTTTISRSQNAIKPSNDISKNNLNFINPFHMRNNQHQGYFQYYDHRHHHQSFFNSYATTSSFIGIDKPHQYSPSFSNTNLMVNKPIFAQTFFTSTLVGSKDNDKTLVNSCGTISFVQKQERYEQTCSGIMGMKIEPKHQDFGVSLSQFDVGDENNKLFPYYEKRGSSAMTNIVGMKKYDSYRSVDYDQHRCGKCNVSFATGNALGGHMSHHSKKRKKEANKVWKKYNPDDKYSFFDFVDSLGFHGCSVNCPSASRVHSMSPNN